MDDPTSLLFGLDGFRVVDVVRVDDRMIQVLRSPCAPGPW